MREWNWDLIKVIIVLLVFWVISIGTVYQIVK